MNCSFRLHIRWRVTGYHWPVYGCIFGLNLLLGSSFVCFTGQRDRNTLSAATPATSELLPRLQLFERWITLSTGYITIQRIAWFVLLPLIHWIAIYPPDSVIHPLNNWGQDFRKVLAQAKNLSSRIYRYKKYLGVRQWRVVSKQFALDSIPSLFRWHNITFAEDINRNKTEIVLVLEFANFLFIFEVYLTIIPRARMGSESIAHEPERRMGYWLRAHEGERNNCFSKIQLGWSKKYRDKTKLC